MKNAGKTPDEVLRAIGDAKPICYPQYDLVMNEALAFTTSIGPRRRIAFLIGASGSGKTCIANWLSKKAFGPQDSWPVGKKPQIELVLRPTDGGFISSKWMSKGLLNAVHDPFRSLPSAISRWDIDELLKSRLSAAVAGLPRIKDHEGEFQDAFISIARAFEIQSVLIDESNVISQVKRSHLPTDFLETIRGLIIAIDSRAIMFGSTTLVDTLDYSAQMNRREHIIHCERMRSNNADWKLFLEELEADLRLNCGTLSKRSKAVHDFSYGIAGEAVELVHRGALRAKAIGARKVEWSHIEDKISPASVIQTIREEADWIESALECYQAGKKKPKKSERLALSDGDRRVRKNARRRARRWPIGNASSDGS